MPWRGLLAEHGAHVIRLLNVAEQAIHSGFNGLNVGGGPRKFIAMSLFRTLVAATCLAGILATPVVAAPRSAADGIRLAWNDRPRDQDRAFRETREGRAMPLPMIERRVKPHMGDADYLGPELRGDSYRLKFMQDGHVIWVDVDAATGRIVRKSTR